MASVDEKMRIAKCLGNTDFKNNWTLLKIGTVNFHSLSELNDEFALEILEGIKYLLGKAF